ncbi:MAG: ATP-grasp domain-containing protein [Nevskia sp.]|nr:ATP-grasp domain-containing protein [Nevskia sp.]
MRVLIVTSTLDWLSVACLPQALQRVGLRCAVLAPRGCLAHLSRCVDLHDYLEADELRQPHSVGLLERACDRAEAQWVIPGDEHCTQWLARIGLSLPEGAPLRALIWRSLGNPDAQGAVTDKLRAAGLAQEAGVAVPRTLVPASREDLLQLAIGLGGPVALKCRTGYGGRNVFLCPDAAALQRAAQQYRSPIPPVLQEMVSGTRWMSSFFADRGRVLATIDAVVERCNPSPTGPSSVLRIEPGGEVAASAARLVAKLGYSGFGNIDFIVDRDGRACLLDFNPRLSAGTQLGRFAGPDPFAAFAAVLKGETYLAPPVRGGTRIALYPQELVRDPSGAGLAGCHHDVLEDEPGLHAEFEARIARARAQAPGP